MANKILQTRIQMKYDTFEVWSAQNPVLLSGEIAIVSVPTGTSAVQSEPIILMKVGDGSTAFNSLPWTGALAADVHAWAKADTKPTYKASEITGIGDYIAQYVGEEMGIAVDTDTVYKIELTEDKNGFVLSSKGKADTAWAVETTISFADVFDAKGAAAGVQTALTAEIDRATAAEKANADAIAAEQLRAEAAEKVNADAIAILNGEGEGSIKKAVDDAINKFASDVTNDDTINSYKELIDWAAEHGSDAADMAAAIQKLEVILDGIGGADEKATVIAYIDDAIAALKIADYAKTDELTALADIVANKVDKEDGKGLSANDFTNELKEKLDGIDAGAQVNAIEKILVNGVEATIAEDKSVDLAIKNNIADLEQDANTYVIFNCGSATVNI